MTNLTEQWKKQTLPLGWYYIKLQDGLIEIQQYIGGFLFDVNNEVVEVLDEVSSYDEWQDLKSKLQLKETAYDFDTARLEEENTKLKELLKECHDIIYETAFKLRSVPEIDKCNEVRKQIRDVLGEEYGFKKVTYYIRDRAKDLGEE